MYNFYQKEDPILDVDGLKYKLTDGYFSGKEAEIIECNTYNSVIKIPDHVIYKNVEYPVTRIKEKVFEGKSLKTIIISNNVTIIGESCFKNCSKLEKVVLPGGLNSLSKNCFYNCSALVNINLPAYMSYIGDDCFYGCGSLTKIVIPKFCNLGANCFSMCRSLRTVILPEEMEGMGSDCFSWCDKLESIKLPSTLTYIPSSAFNCCKALRSINIPENVTILDSSCFSGCDALTEVKIPVNVKEIGVYAFHNCKSLQRVSIMNIETKLMRDCFSDCPSLMEIVFPKNEMQIDDICVDLCPLLSEQTKRHIKITEEGKRRAEERTVKSKIKRAIAEAWDYIGTAIILLIVAPILLIGYFVYMYAVKLSIAIGLLALFCFIVGLIIMLLIGLLVEIEHKFDWKYNCACLIIGAIIVGIIYLLNK